MKSSTRFLEGFHIAIAMPIFNEADGIEETLTSIDSSFYELGAQVLLFIQDDVSTDNTLDVLNRLSQSLHMSIDVKTNEKNMGHGPTTFAAYHRAICSGAPIVMQLDSDGQFDARELPILCNKIANGNDVVIGVRNNRKDPWFRKILTFVLRNFLRVRYFGKFPDPNSPIRVYSTSTLTSLLRELPSEPLIPNIYLSVLSVQQKLKVAYIPVSHRERRGDESTGTMWQSSSQWKKIGRLLKFCRRSFQQLLSF